MRSHEAGGPGPGTPIVPRWEWRTFAAGADAAARLAVLTPDQTQESTELYLLALGGEGTVKVRDGLVDVKQLEEVDDRGLERWRPAMKAPFPLDAEDVRVVGRALGLAAPVREGPPGGLDELLRGLADRGAVHTVTVSKRRRRYTVSGCMVELTDVRVGQDRAQTIAVESEEPTRVWSTVEALGLDARMNTSYPRALRAMIGLGGRRGAVIDVGTNSVKLLVGESSDGGPWRTIVDRAVVTRLGEGLAEGGPLGAEPMGRTIEAICDMVRQARATGALDLAAVGTAGLRMAANSAAFVDAVRARCGVGVEIISGEEESRLGYRAVEPLTGGGASVVVFETGGGSSQFTFGHGGHVDEQFSVDVGAARFTERFGLDGVVSRAVLGSALAAIAAGLSRLDGRPRPDALIGMGGALTNLAAVRHELATYAADIVEGTVLDRAEIDRQIDLYRALTADERRRITGLQPARAEVILAGACIVRTVLDMLGCDTLTVSDRGLRHALLTERLERDHLVGA